MQNGAYSIRRLGRYFPRGGTRVWHDYLARGRIVISSLVVGRPRNSTILTVMTSAYQPFRIGVSGLFCIFVNGITLWWQQRQK